jgi:hypothetical protein
MQGLASGRESSPYRVRPDKNCSGGAGGRAPRLDGEARQPLDTLAQPCQFVPGDDQGKLLRRARAKYFTFPLATQLADLRTMLEKSYRNTIYCARLLRQDESGKIRGKYCGNRWCLVCNRIRLARAINRYHPVIAAWHDPWFVTLTLPNVRGEALSETLDAMLRHLGAIGRAIKRTDRLPFRALRKLECTHNSLRSDFHPHFHPVVDGRDSALALRRRWLACHPEATLNAQDVRRCDERSMVELFKYFTKLLTKGADARTIAPPQALDVIFIAFRKRRVFQPMGFKAAVPIALDDNAEIGSSGDTNARKRIGERIRWEWLQSMHDWVDLSSGDLLTSYEPSASFTSPPSR